MENDAGFEGQNGGAARDNRGAKQRGAVAEQGKNRGEIQALEYPRIWEYAIITTDKNALEAALGEIFAALSYELKPSKQSSGGKYASLRLSIRVMSEAQRDEIFTRLNLIKCVRAVV